VTATANGGVGARGARLDSIFAAHAASHGFMLVLPAVLDSLREEDCLTGLGEEPLRRVHQMGYRASRVEEG
jgi:hypothetical protein